MSKLMKLSKYKNYFSVNFYSLRFSYLFAISVFGAVVIAKCDNLDYLDSLFLTISAVSGTGLSTVSMLALTTPTFIVLAL